MRALAPREEYTKLRTFPPLQKKLPIWGAFSEFLVPPPETKKKIIQIVHEMRGRGGPPPHLPRICAIKVILFFAHFWGECERLALLVQYIR